MKRRHSMEVLLAVLSALAMVNFAAAAKLYRQDFPSDKGEFLQDVDWDDSYIGGNGNSAGVAANDTGDQYLWWYNATGLSSETTVTAACVTSKLPSVPASTPDLTFSWEQRLENQRDDSDADVTGTPVEVRLAVEVGGRWYASEASFKTTEAGVGNGGQWDARRIVFDPAAKNWRELTLADSEAKLGEAPASDLSGDLSGVGFVATFSQWQTVNFHFLEIEAAAAADSSAQKVK